MDDANPYHRAKQAGLQIAGSPEFCVLLADHERITIEQAVEAIHSSHASKKQKQHALVVLEILKRAKGA